VESSGNVFLDLGFNEESANLLLRADLMIAIVEIFDAQNWSNAEAAKALSVRESRISELRHGGVGKFSVDLLLKYLARLGKKVSVTVKDVGQVA
jgi:predicted XRE-type DNA-binding protein